MSEALEIAKDYGATAAVVVALVLAGYGAAVVRRWIHRRRNR